MTDIEKIQWQLRIEQEMLEDTESQVVYHWLTESLSKEFGLTVKEISFDGGSQAIWTIRYHRPHVDNLEFKMERIYILKEKGTYSMEWVLFVFDNEYDFFEELDLYEYFGTEDEEIPFDKGCSALKEKLNKILNPA